VWRLDRPPRGAGGAARLSRKAARKEGRARKAAGDDVSRAFKEAQAGVDAAERRAAQSALLEALFEALFRVLKHATASGLLALGRPGEPCSGLGAGLAQQPALPRKAGTPTRRCP
jgi:hypothetical protein